MNEVIITIALILLLIYFIWFYTAVKRQEADMKARPRYYEMLNSVNMSDPPEVSLAKQYRYEASINEKGP